jgi:hypothetical protein
MLPISPPTPHRKSVAPCHRNPRWMGPTVPYPSLSTQILLPSHLFLPHLFLRPAPTDGISHAPSNLLPGERAAEASSSPSAPPLLIPRQARCRSSFPASAPALLLRWRADRRVAHPASAPPPQRLLRRARPLFLPRRALSAPPTARVPRHCGGFDVGGVAGAGGTGGDVQGRGAQVH